MHVYLHANVVRVVLIMGASMCKRVATPILVSFLDPTNPSVDHFQYRMHAGRRVW